eukprot:2392407-Prymnesium_polylepis.1
MLARSEVPRRAPAVRFRHRSTSAKTKCHHHAARPSLMCWWVTAVGCRRERHMYHARDVRTHARWAPGPDWYAVALGLDEQDGRRGMLLEHVAQHHLCRRGRRRDVDARVAALLMLERLIHPCAAVVHRWVDAVSARGR